MVWWLGRKQGLVVNGKRVLRVMRERGLLVRQGRFQVSRRKDWGKVEALYPNHVWQSDMTKVCAGPAVGWAYLVAVIDGSRKGANPAIPDFPYPAHRFNERSREFVTAAMTWSCSLSLRSL